MSILQEGGGGGHSLKGISGRRGGRGIVLYCGRVLANGNKREAPRGQKKRRRESDALSCFARELPCLCVHFTVPHLIRIDPAIIRHISQTHKRRHAAAAAVLRSHIALVLPPRPDNQTPAALINASIVMSSFPPRSHPKRLHTYISLYISVCECDCKYCYWSVQPSAPD